MKRDTPLRFENRTTGRIRGTPRSVDAAARLLRQRMTPAERVLWQALRGHQLGGLQFRRQHAVGRFVLDFYCPAAKLAVEVDGDIHDQQQELDDVRTAHLTAYGYRVVPFRNEEILTNLPNVLQHMLHAAQSARTTQRPASLINTSRD